MSSLDDYFSSDLVGFFSYSREDDEGFNDALSKLRTAIQQNLGAQLGRRRNDFRIWQDKSAIPDGALWEKKIKEGISQAAFFIPIVTPRAVKSTHCAFEFESFLAREAELGRDDLVFPILYIPVPALDDGTWQDHPVLRIVEARQYRDWRDLRYRDPRTPEIQERIVKYCDNIANALRKTWVTPEERRNAEEAKARQRAEEEERRKKAAIEAAQAVKQERKRREVEATRLADEEERRKAAQIEAARAAEEEERRKAAQIEAARAAEEEERRKAAQIEAARIAEEEERRKAAQIEAARVAEQEQPKKPAEVQTPEGAAAASEQRADGAVSFTAVRRKVAQRPRAAMMTGGALAAVLLVGIMVWTMNKPTPPNQQASITASPAPAKPAMPDQKAAITPASPAVQVNTPVLPTVQQQTPTLREASPAKPQAAPPSKPTVSVTPVPLPVPTQPPPVPSTPVQRPTELADAGPTAPVPVPPSPRPTWADCSPNPAQTTLAMGGTLQSAKIKVALTKAQQGVIAIRTIAISPDGKTLVTAGDDGIIRVWDAATLKWIRPIAGDGSPVYSLAFSIDGNFLASAGFDGSVRVWDGHNFTPVSAPFTITDDKGPVKQYGVAFEARNNPQFVVSVGADGMVRVWDIHTGQLAKPPVRSSNAANPTTGSLSFVPNESGSYATANFAGTISFFNPGRTDTINAFPGGKALRLAYSPDGTLVAAAGADTPGETSGVKIWNAATHALFKALPAHHGHAASVAWSHDRTRLATGGGYTDPTVALWDVQSGKQLPQFNGHTADNDAKDFENRDVEAVAFHPNQKWLVSANESGKMKIWDLANGKELLSVVGIPGGSDYVAYTPNGCYTGSANAASYVRYVTSGSDQSGTALLVPNGDTGFLLPQ